MLVPAIRLSQPLISSNDAGAAEDAFAFRSKSWRLDDLKRWKAGLLARLMAQPVDAWYRFALHRHGYAVADAVTMFRPVLLGTALSAGGCLLRG